MNKIAISLLGLSLLCAAPLIAADKPMPGKMDPAMMQKMQEAGAPGPNQQAFQQAAGHWTYTSRAWMQPGAPPMDSRGTSEMSVILGGRFLQQTVKGDMNGVPFEGMGFVGFDKIKGEYQSVWMDNMITGMVIGSGSPGAATKTITQTGHFGCPMTNDKNQWYRSEWTMVDADHQTYAMFDKGPDGKEHKGMEILYTRAK